MMTVMMIAATAPAGAQPVTQNVQQLERDIEKHEKNIKDKESAIKDLEETAQGPGVTEEEPRERTQGGIQGAQGEIHQTRRDGL